MKKGPKFQRKASTIQKALKAQGLTSIPRGKIAAHRKSLWKGGTDTPRNIHFIKTSTHKRKTAQETRERARRRSA